MNARVSPARAGARTAPPGRAFRPPSDAGAALAVTRYCVPQGSGDSRTARSLSSHLPGGALRRPPAAGRCPSGRVRPAASGARP